jgi:hypothetical protein
MADLGRGIAREPLNVPKSKPAADNEVKQDSAADQKNEFCSK